MVKQDKKKFLADHQNFLKISESLIGKLVRRCGADSPVIVTMGIDSLEAGLDTSGSSAAFLLYHIASNPEKQVQK